MGIRRLFPVLALALVAGCGGGQPATLTPPPVLYEPPPAPSVTVKLDQEPVPTRRELAPSQPLGAALTAEEVHAAWRREELKKVRRSHTVAGALHLALLAHAINGRQRDSLLRDYTAARRSAARLSGLRRSELSAVIASVDRLAATGQLSAGRLGPVFLLLRRNRQFWTRYAKLPAPSARVTFGSDPAIFQYYPGRGMQLQQLASWGRINAMLHNCQIGRRCPTGLLRYSLNKLVRQAAPRGGFLAWESYFPFGGSSSPWISGMTQGTAVQALARGARVLHAPRYLRVAERSLGAFQTPPPLGVAVPAPGGTHYLMYSFAPGLRILNGDLQAITGLRDLAALGGSRRARRLYRRGDGAARRLVARYDTGAWSLYSLGGRESSLGYHKLVTEFLGNLCDRSGGHPYCAAHRRFAAYLRQPPRIHIARLVRLRMHRATTVRFTLSKVSGVAVRVTGPHGVSLYRRLTLTRGAHTLGWTPPARGIYHVQVVAQGPSGPHGSARETVRVTLPLPKPHHRQRKGSRAASKHR